MAKPQVQSVTCLIDLSGLAGGGETQVESVTCLMGLGVLSYYLEKMPAGDKNRH